MKELVRFRVFFINGPHWDSLSQSQRSGLARNVSESPLFGEPPKRFGFAKVRFISDNSVLGYFTQEFTAKRHKYDQAKHEHPYTDLPFEDSLTILMIDRGLAFLQSRRFRDETISMTGVLRNFELAVRTLVRGSDLPFYGLDPYILRYDRTAFLKLFSTNSVLNVSVTGLSNKVVPEDFKFFNPEAEKDEIVRQMMNTELRSLDQLSIGSSDKGSGLQTSKVARMALTVGDPQEMTFKEGDTGVIRTIRHQIGPTHSVEIDTETLETAQIRKDLDRFFSRQAGKLIRQRNLESAFGEDEDDKFGSGPGNSD